MATPLIIKQAFREQQKAEKSLNEYIKFLKEYNIKKALKIEKLRDQL